MHVTLHLTSGCNMSCSYCYAAPGVSADMPEATLDAAIDLAAALSPGNVGLVFFGGEPLLRRDLVERGVAHCREIESGRPIFHFKITTNGLLIDEDFLDFAARERVHVALSLDGLPQAHDRHRLTRDGQGTSSRIEGKAALLLERQPSAPVLLTVTPHTVDKYAASVEHLFDLGFRYVVASLDYSGSWTDAGLAVLEVQYRQIANLYERMTLAGRKLYFSPFEKKLASHIHGTEAICRRCHFGVRQISVAPDGSIFPCVQFAGGRRPNGTYRIGHVAEGLDRARQMALYEASRQVDEPCRGCAIEGRCEHLCSCLNWQTTGAINTVSAVLCATERILVPIADELGRRLFRQRAPLFVQKHYNAAYPLISCLEDATS
jgi:uncharacterized protein